MCNKYGNRGFGVRHEHFRRNFGHHDVGDPRMGDPRMGDPRMGGPRMGGPREGDPREFRVPVNIVKNDNSYQLFVFAPDRKKDDFKISINGQELSISYALTNNQSDAKNWIRHEFSKTAFERSFIIDQTVDTENIVAEYVNGILQLTLPIIPGSEKPVQEIRVS
ncbi:Hsp20/alpha crystallin family protein [Dyadobacter sp. CY323]|uniref:Hsp20/alpha crystallin family protein n=1 Tax=Dyadobacter sp. CY323 TaxID=2907302 RepID=UPI001F3AA67D|nr:Hsp20/alpha crystallin family protein [Dyadobacter sp. CY323]MCE6992335.1 Hsp20/alpha crystallin family protein [Dyadobacter sp. CY323]